MNISEDIDFQWDYDEELVRKSNNHQKPKVHLNLSEFKYNQSTQQAFYFLEDISIEGNELMHDDWIIAYNGDNVIGYSKYSGRFLDVPAMGYDGYSTTFGYCIDGDIPSFKVFRESTGELIDMVLDPDFFNSWANNMIFNVKSMSEYTLPKEHRLLNAYPNPFNATTNISFELSDYANTKLDIYNINGQLIENIVNEGTNPGYHSFDWNANNYGSGIYFIRLNIDDNYYQTKKVVLVK